MGLKCLQTSIFIETPSLEGFPTKAKEDPSPHEMRLSPAGHQPSIFWSRDYYYYYYYYYYCCCYYSYSYYYYCYYYFAQKHRALNKFEWALNTLLKLITQHWACCFEKREHTSEHHVYNYHPLRKRILSKTI